MDATAQIDEYIAGLEAKVSRAIDLQPGQDLDEAALRDLVRSAAAG